MEKILNSCKQEVTKDFTTAALTETFQIDMVQLT